MNRSNQSEEHVSGHGSPSGGSVRARNTSDPTNTSGSVNDSVLTSNVLAEAISEIQDTIQKTESENLASEEEKVRTAETTMTTT